MPTLLEQFEDAKGALLEPAATLVAVQEIEGGKVRQLTRDAYGKLVSAHLLINGVLWVLLRKSHGKLGTYSRPLHESEALIASFVIGLSVCERAIEEGRYLQSAALLRQEMEIIAQLMAVRSDSRKPQRSPSIASLEETRRRHYSSLSDAAHAASHEIIESLTLWQGHDPDMPDGTRATRFFPAIDVELSRRTFSLHLVLMLDLVEEVNELYADRDDIGGLTESEVGALRVAIALMASEGMVESIEE